MSSKPIIVFAGPSLPDLASARERLTVKYLGPAAQGDLLREALLKPSAIVLIDGYFEYVPSVYHKEILWALDQGIPVYGAASLGALRAVELRPFGMIGVGAIYDAFASGALSRDDEVALIHAPREAHYRPLSDPLVNIRWTLAAAVDEGVIEGFARDRILAHASAMFYPERTYAALLEEERRVSQGAARRLADWLKSGRIDQKQRDALACLDRVAKDQSEKRRFVPPSFAFSHTDAFESMLIQIARDPLSGSTESNDEAFELLRAISPERAAALEAEAELEALALWGDAHVNLPVPPEDLVRQVAAFRERYGIGDPSSLRQWLAARGLDIDTLSKRVDEDARIARARAFVRQNAATRVLNKVQLLSQHS